MYFVVYSRNNIKVCLRRNITEKIEIKTFMEGVLVLILGHAWCILLGHPKCKVY